ncbi:MAG: coproporphyrinogen dehydrogenase HemZ [Clostridia bacterium]|nr:coproporphyrinogen dehydrogenase HemZ [Clostridia bacterium]
MKLIINGPVKPYYIQMLAMLFYPGEKFPEGVEADEETKVAEVTVEQLDSGVRSYVKITDGDASCEGEAFLPFDGLDTEKLINFSAGGAFLNACTKLTGHIPPWGMLTGVRPARLAADLLSSGLSPEEAKKYFTEVYRTSSGKAHLAVSTAEVSERIITPESRKECSVYVSIPFCPSRCSYCSFVSATSPKLLAMIPEYLNALVADIHRTFALIKELGLRVATVYIGGGTPTVLNESELRILLEALYPYVGGVDEFTLEAGRPDTITVGKLSSAKELGVTRVSVNTQTLNDDVLKNIGRAHTAEDFLRAYELAEASGIKDINVDLIAGLPGDDYESFKMSVDRIAQLDPTNVTVHTFSVKKSAEFKTGGFNVYNRDGKGVSDAVDYSQDALVRAGYLPYYMYRQKNTVGNLENVGYSKPGHEGLYNIYMMDEIHSIFACGGASVTKIVTDDGNGGTSIERLFEPKYPYEYLSIRRTGEFQQRREQNESLIRKLYGRG